MRVEMLLRLEERRLLYWQAASRLLSLQTLTLPLTIFLLNLPLICDLRRKRIPSSPRSSLLSSTSLVPLPQGDDLRFDLEVDFKTALFGGQKKIRIAHMETCGTCTGSGVAPGASVTTCPTCGGRGVTTQVWVAANVMSKCIFD